MSLTTDAGRPGPHDPPDAIGARIAAVKRMGGSRDPRHASAVVQALRAGGHPHLRRAAAGALGSIGGDEALAALLEVESPTHSVRRAVTRSLGVLGDPRAVPALMALLEDERACDSAARALGRIGDPAAVPGLAAMTASDSWVSRSIARAALVQTGLPEAVGTLRERPRRNPLSRRRELAAAERAVARRRARESGELPSCADRLPLRLRLAAVKALLVASLIVIASDALAGADRGRMAWAAVGALAGMGWLLFVLREVRQANVDLIRWRAHSDLRLPRWRSPARTALAVLGFRPLATLLWLTLPVGAECLLGGPGLVAGVMAGVCVAMAWERFGNARRTARVERERGEILLIEGSAVPDPITRRRTFLAGDA